MGFIEKILSFMKVLDNSRKEEEIKRKVLTEERESGIQMSQAQIKNYKKCDFLRISSYNFVVLYKRKRMIEILEREKKTDQGLKLKKAT